MVEASPRGRPTSWIAAAVVIAGFIIAGLGLVFTSWLVFWLGAAVVVLGGVFGAATGIMNDVH
jgi:hypothetical protein